MFKTLVFIENRYRGNLVILIRKNHKTLRFVVEHVRVEARNTGVFLDLISTKYLFHGWVLCKNHQHTLVHSTACWALSAKFLDFSELCFLKLHFDSHLLFLKFKPKNFSIMKIAQVSTILSKLSLNIHDINSN